MLSSERFDFQTNPKTVNTQIRLVNFSRVSFSRETEKQVICPDGFPVVGFLLTPYFTPIQVGTSTTTSERGVMKLVQ